MHWEILTLYNYRIYLDNVSECLLVFKEYASTPPKYVIHTPLLFNEWLRWAKEIVDMRSNTRNNEKPVFIRPMGEKICPNWVRYDFKDLEDFYKYYKALIIED